MSVVRANIVRNIDDKHDLHINAYKNGWLVEIVDLNTSKTKASQVCRFQIDGVIAVMKLYRKDQPND